MKRKSAAKQSVLPTALITAVLTAIATAVGAGLVNDWLPRLISYVKGDSILVIKVISDQKPVNKVRFAMVKPPNTSTPVSSGITDDQGYVFLSPGTGQFLLQGTLCRESSDQDLGYSQIVKIEKLPDNKIIEVKAFQLEKHAECLHAPPSPEMEIKNLSITSNKTYIPATLDERSTAYVDRSYSFTKIPSFLRRRNYIVTANDDKCPNDPATFSLRFDATGPSTIYVAHDDRYQKKPAWMKSFENTKATLTLTLPGTNDEYSFTLYRKDFPAGTVALGANIEGTCQQEGDFGMYSVIVAPPR
jgi:hypothetical protein